MPPTPRQDIIRFAAEALPREADSLQPKSVAIDRARTFSKNSYVLAALRSDIISAKFKPNARLHLKSLMACYDTSVAPVREALAVLAGVGLAISEGRRGFRVAPVSREDFLDTAAMRKLLEVSALKTSIELGSDDWVREIRRVHKTFSRISQKAGHDDPISGA
ncbi:GntR family transcriptional regulator [Bradyrhizobium sp. S69]|uniref:GntR family transcriptional regulator n=1 Tax=Bradyrhizobium sp. S69 TaxID=1641856 RepID=UPI00131C9203|nr:GntR family transcriptional regulator [Bradyrhizobium sp. S69]